MDIKDLNELAKIQVDAILSQNLSKIEVISLLSLLQARIMLMVYSDMGKEVKMAPQGPETPTAPITRTVETPKPKPVKYDPVYDPEPPFEPDKIPERPVSTRVLAEPNHACVCVACNKVAYTVNRLIKDGDKIDDFLASYTPMPGVKPLTRKIEISNVDGQISIDCVLCGANKSLYLTGHPVHL